MGLLLMETKQRDARPVKYAYSNPPAKSKWYSRSMGITWAASSLIFLVIHSAHFWIPNQNASQV
jgi:succinate dehydrogenase / fumarate reductase cytochrome b subunit